MAVIRGWLGVAALTLSSVTAVAQSQLTISPPGTHGPVTGKPYTAHKVEHQLRYLANGTISAREWQVTEARNAQGVMACDSKRMMAGQGDLSVALEVHAVSDPVHHTDLHWSNLNHVTQMIHLPASNSFASVGKLGPPDPALFELPAGDDLHEIRTRGSFSDQKEVLAAIGPDTAQLPAMSYADAPAELGDPMHRETAAAVLVKMAAAGNDPVQKDKIAYAVARLNLQLAAAEGLEQAVVTGGRAATGCTAADAAAVAQDGAGGA
jgi:hypothetical protein